MSLLKHLSRRIFRPSVYPLSSLCTTSSPSVKSIDQVNSLFAEARLCLQDAADSKGTVYFADDFADAKQATQDTLSAFESLLESSTPKDRVALIEANRPKMAQLEQEFRQLEDELIHDE